MKDSGYRCGERVAGPQGPSYAPEAYDVYRWGEPGFDRPTEAASGGEEEDG